MENWTEERRRSPRAPEGLCAWLSFSNTPAAYSTLTLDVGTGGAQLRVVRRVRVGEKVLILLQLQGGDIECRGKVCWAKPAEGAACVCGVQFLGLSGPDRQRLEALLSRAALASLCA